MRIPSRLRYKDIAKMRRNAKEYIPNHLCYCYGVMNNGSYGNCKFLSDESLNSYVKKYRKGLIDSGDFIGEEVSAMCNLTGNWIFDYCKHCGVNEKFKLDKNGEQMW